MADSKLFQHVIVTRFNCSNSRSPTDREIAIRSRPGWLDERFDLFERYCLPSVHAQTEGDFRWHIYFDHLTPDRYLDRARQGFAGRTNFMIKLCELYGSETLQEDLPKDIGSSKDWVVTTRLDNDDGIAPDFVERLHREVKVGTVEALNIPVGIVYQDGRFYVSRQPSNAFISLSEPLQGLSTATRYPHNQMDRHFALRDLEGGPGWLQVVHGSNVSNKVRGVRVPRASVPEAFAKMCGESSGSGAESGLAISFENATAGVARVFRDRLAKSVRAMRGR